MSLLYLLSGLIKVMQAVILLRCILSLFPRADMRVVRFLHRMTEPLLRPIREILFRSSLLKEVPLDFSPVAAILALMVLDYFIMLFAR